MNKEFDFSKEFGKIDEKLVENAGMKWERQKYYVFQLYSRKIACAAMILVLGFAAASNSRVQAAMKEVITKIGQIWGVTNDLLPYTETINQSQVKEGIAITLNEVILSDSRIYSSITFQTDFEKGIVEMADYITINGVDYPVQVSSRQDYELGELSSDQIFTQVVDADIIPDKITDLGLHYRAYQTYEATAAISFDFIFSVSREELEQQVIHVPMEQKYVLDDGTEFILTELTLAPVDSVICVEFQNLPESRWIYEEFYDWDFYLVGKDSMGRDVCFFSEMGNSPESARFISGLQSGLLPSVNSEWIELQLYTYQRVNEEEWQVFDNVNGEDVYMKDDIGPINKVYIGNKFKINIGESMQNE